MTKLTEAQMIEILKNGAIEQCSQVEKAQVMAFAFGEEFMNSEDKGAVKRY